MLRSSLAAVFLLPLHATLVETCVSSHSILSVVRKTREADQCVGFLTWPMFVWRTLSKHTHTHTHTHTNLWTHITPLQQEHQSGFQEDFHSELYLQQVSATTAGRTLTVTQMFPRSRRHFLNPLLLLKNCRNQLFTQTLSPFSRKTSQKASFCLKHVSWVRVNWGIVIWDPDLQTFPR